MLGQFWCPTCCPSCCCKHAINQTGETLTEQEPVVGSITLSSEKEFPGRVGKGGNGAKLNGEQVSDAMAQGPSRGWGQRQGQLPNPTPFPRLKTLHGLLRSVPVLPLLQIQVNS